MASQTALDAADALEELQMSVYGIQQNFGDVETGDKL